MLAVALPPALKTSFEGSVRRFPCSGIKRRGDSPTATSCVGGQRSVAPAIAYAFNGGRRAEEEVVLRLRPQLARSRGRSASCRVGNLRARSVDLKPAPHRDEGGKGETKHWSETPRRCRCADICALRLLARDQGAARAAGQGETITVEGQSLRAETSVGFGGALYGGRDRIRMAGRTIAADHFSLSIPRFPNRKAVRQVPRCADG